MNDLINRKDLLDLLDKSISESNSDVDTVLTAVKRAVALMPSADPQQNLFCPFCKWREFGLADEKNCLQLEGVAGLGFDEALKYLKRGMRMKRKGWNGKGIFIELQVPNERSKMTQPYIYIDTLGLETSNPNAPKGRVPWLASQTDMLAEDWSFAK